MRQPVTRRFKLTGPIPAVKLQEHPGSSLRTPTDMLVEIPADAVVELEGVVARSGLVNIVWNGDVFSVFYEDFEKKSPITARDGNGDPNPPA